MEKLIENKKSTDIKTGDNSNVTIHKNSHNKKWTKSKISIVSSLSLAFSGLGGVTSYLIHANSQLSTKVDFILNVSNKLIIQKLDTILDNLNEYIKIPNILKNDLLSIKSLLEAMDKKYASVIKEANIKIKKIESEIKLKWNEKNY